MNDATLRGAAFTALTMAIWVVFIVVSRWCGTSGLTPFDITALRIGASAIVLLPWWGPRLLHSQRPRLRWYQAVTLSMLAGIGYPLLAYLGFAHAPGAHGALLMAGMLPVVSALMGVAVLGERLRRGRIVAMMLVLAGIGVAISTTSARLASSAGGDLLLLAAGLSWALFTALIRRWEVDAFDVTLGVVCVAALVYLPLYALLLPKRLDQVAPPMLLGIGLFHGAVVVCIAMWTYARAVQELGPTRVASLMSSVPALGTLGCVVMLHEP